MGNNRISVNLQTSEYRVKSTSIFYFIIFIGALKQKGSDNLDA